MARFAFGLLGLLALWRALALAVPDAFLVAGPAEVAAHLAANGGLYARALAATLAAAAVGFLIGNAVAVALAVFSVVLPGSARVISGLALIVFCLPLVATGPVLRVLYGPGTGPQVTLAALAVFYTTFVPVLVGLRAVPPGWLDLVASYGQGGITALWHVRARASMPYLVAGLQIAAPAAFLGAMVGEFTGAERGMGVLTLRAMRDLDVAATWALASVAAAVAMAAHVAIGLLAKRVLAEPAPLLTVPPATRPASGIFEAIVVTLATAAIALVGWWGLLEAFGLNSFFAKRPGDVWAFIASGPGALEHRLDLAAALAQTAVALVPGYFLGLTAGAGLAILLTLAPWLGAVAMPVALALRAVPIVTTAPLLVMLAGRGTVGSAVIVAVMVFFPALIACLHGLQRAPGQVLDVMHSYGAGPWRAMIYARLPAMLPAFLAAARMTVPAAVLAVTVAEWLATGQGIGALMALSASLSEYSMLWSATALVAALAVLVHAGVARIERRVLSVFAGEQVQ